jgi:hypothetical protein
MVIDALIFSLSKRQAIGDYALGLVDTPSYWWTLRQSGDRTYALGFLGEDLGIHAYILGNGLHACARYFYGDLGDLLGLGYLGLG